ncbi:glycosyltransferase family 4 protein [Yeosuana sp. MJ-SS3]|uniref:Glycosyltransferase family 4 protein n=1 Tax=Gilvirhabdus luticola TaxID=3079858 RepID=A0ABU3U569_9FLAO|nr:glycosyltransferase family 4 protein [Yeosuana sp. MJ-SS3]MDU8885462.1 glycosyltransferase family 4 protein [Yeosuana sp. MJ-SS3]
MKVGIVLSKTPTYSETFFLSKIRGLQKHGFVVSLYVQKEDVSFKLCNVVQAPRFYRKNKFLQILAIFQVIFRLLPFLIRLQNFIKLERKVDRSWHQILKNIYNNAHILTAELDWLHFGFATMALQSEHVAQVIDAKMAVSLRGFDIDVYALQHPNCYSLLWKQVDKVHSISNYLLDKAKLLGLSNEISYSIIRPAVDLLKFNPVNRVLSEPINFLTVGRLHWIKGLIYTLEALAILKVKGVKFNYTIIGSGPDYEPIVFAISQLGLTKEVRLLGKKTHKDTLGYFTISDIYIQYSISEGFCNAVLEAQGMGCLCVVSDGGALPENVIHRQTGWVVPKRNPKLLANALQEVILLPEDVKGEYRKNATKRVIEAFSLDLQQKTFREFYN